MKLYPNLHVRLSRAGFATLGTYTLTNDWDVTPIAISEITSVTSEIVTILPYFGSILWMLLLFPTFTRVYYDVIIHNASQNQEKEINILKYCSCMLLFIMTVTILIKDHA